MYLRIIGSVCTALFLLNSVVAQQSGAGSQELKLDLEQFPNTGNQDAGDQAGSDTPGDELELNLEQFDNSDQTAPVSSNEELELNLEQFDNTDERESDDLELNLDQFDNKNEPATQINNSGSSATRIEKTAVPKYNYLPLFIGGGLVFLAFMVILSRRGKRRR